MATLTSSDGFMILFHLLRRGYTDGDKTTCAISNKELADVMGTSISSVRRAIDTLKQLNLISCSQNKGALCTFYVNWSEIRAIHKVSSQISDKGWVYLRGLCLNSEVRPISAIPLTILNDVVRQYPHTSLNMNTPSLNMNTPLAQYEHTLAQYEHTLAQYEHTLAQYEHTLAQYEHTLANRRRKR
ncbi:helix-turn-helix domain-containing protein [Bacteroides thetaiotaomicron]|nr:helix-turn-helix domain-containing protein [Bacteroides thetaiotaomicron]